MPSQVVLYEGGDEEVAVVVAVAQPHVEADPGRTARFLEQLWLELSFDEAILSPLVDEDRGALPSAICDQRGRVVFAPCRAIRAEVARERLLAPWASHRRGDWSEG